MDHATIYVKLLDEGVDAWRPVAAEQTGETEYTILGAAPDPELERWEFRPGDRVQCASVERFEGRVLVAVSRAPR
jgi:hypothetical protein